MKPCLTADQKAELKSFLQNLVGGIVLLWFLVEGIQQSCRTDLEGGCIGETIVALLIAFGAGRLVGEWKGYAKGKDDGRVEAIRDFIDRTKT